MFDVNFHHFPQHEWSFISFFADHSRFGFISAGGGVWYTRRLDKRSIGIDGVQVAANCTGGMTKSAAFFFDPRSRRLAALYADPQLKKAHSSPRLLRALASGGNLGILNCHGVTPTIRLK